MILFTHFSFKGSTSGSVVDNRQHHVTSFIFIASFQQYILFISFSIYISLQSTLEYETVKNKENKKKNPAESHYTASSNSPRYTSNNVNNHQGTLILSSRILRDFICMLLSVLSFQFVHASLPQ